MPDGTDPHDQPRAKSSQVRLPKAQCHVRCLHLALGDIALWQPENVAVPPNRALYIARRDRDEVHLLDTHDREAISGASGVCKSHGTLARAI